MLQEAHAFFWNFLWVELKAATSVSEHVKQSPVADLGPELAALSCESLLEFDSSPFWSVSSTLTFYRESPSQSTVLPKAFTAYLSLGLAAALTRLWGRLMSSVSRFSGLLLATSSVGQVLCPLLMLSSSVPAQAICCFDLQVCRWRSGPISCALDQGLV